jgi:diguanylate cyclase (GGDEF)-like protein
MRFRRQALRRVLLVEDDRLYAEAVAAHLEEECPDGVRIGRCERLSEVPAALQALRPECALVDLTLPDAQGAEVVRTIRELDDALPIVVLTGLDDDGTAVELVQQGAQDYLLKSETRGTTLARALRYAIERKRTERALAHQALHDSLTGLPNRALLVQRLEHALGRSRRTGGRVGVLFMDLDEFKTVNDTLGHSVGDGLLRAVARRLRRLLRPGDTVARFGGDEFVVVCEDMSAEHEPVVIARRIIDEILRPVPIADTRVSISPSIGVVLSSANASAEGLLSDADVAMYGAKRARTGWQVFDAGMRSRVVQRFQLKSELSQALVADRLAVHYQPQVDLASGELVGVEALVRWRGDEGGVSPQEFVPLAEETGLIGPLGRAMRARVARDLHRWATEMPAGRRLQVSLNLSGREIADDRAVDAILESLDGHPDSFDICCEITESGLLDLGDATERRLSAIRSCGASIMLDDFGTGYGSLSALVELPIDGIKIDRSFVIGLDEEPSRRRLVAGMLILAAGLRLSVVGEGVETTRAAVLLRELGCSQAQGFLFSGAEPPETVERWLREGHTFVVPEALAQ